jgi:hypothetical protein
MTGRPKLLTKAMPLSMLIEAEHMAVLRGSMLADYRERVKPRASLADLVRSLLIKAVQNFERNREGRSLALAKVRAQRRQELRKAALACVGAPDSKVEQHARRLAALLSDAEGPAA